MTCHCGKLFENTRFPGGPRKFGRRQKHCSDRCTAIATKCRYYGLDPKEFWQMHALGCAICGHHWKPGERQLAIDHEHVKFYTKLPANDRRALVRGLLCIECNRWRVGKNDLASARAVIKYLELFEQSRHRKVERLE